MFQLKKHYFKLRENALFSILAFNIFSAVPILKHCFKLHKNAP